jgi:hypothetical protein
MRSSAPIIGLIAAAVSLAFAPAGSSGIASFATATSPSAGGRDAASL